jgi:hypothetical protein
MRCPPQFIAPGLFGPRRHGKLGMNANPPQPTCAYCGDVLGLHEPLVLLLPGEPARMTTRFDERRLPGYAIVLHESCHSRPRPAGREPGSL